jgi:hypothetical protein
MFFHFVDSDVSKAYKRNIPIKLFDKKKGVAAKREKQREQDKALIKVVDTTADIPPNEEMKLDSPSAPSSTGGVPNGTQNPMLCKFRVVKLVDEII